MKKFKSQQQQKISIYIFLLFIFFINILHFFLNQQVNYVFFWEISSIWPLLGTDETILALFSRKKLIFYKYINISII